MGKVTVTLTQRDGQAIVIEDAATGTSLMEVARANKVDGILGDCGGGCACATCHVYVEPQWLEVVGAPEEIEDMTLDTVPDIRRDNSRLSCQIILGPELDGLRVQVAPEQP